MPRFTILQKFSKSQIWFSMLNNLNNAINLAVTNELSYKENPFVPASIPQAALGIIEKPTTHYQ